MFLEDYSLNFGNMKAINDNKRYEYATIAKNNIFVPVKLSEKLNPNIANPTPNKVAPFIIDWVNNFMLLTSFKSLVNEKADIYKKVSALNDKNYTRDFGCYKSSQPTSASIRGDLT